MHETPAPSQPGGGAARRSAGRVWAAPQPGSPRVRLSRRLQAGPLLADGGMGTLLYGRGVPQRACLEELARTRPDLVGAAHREYLEAGAELITTLTLGANRHRLAGHGLASETALINRRAAQVAREAREVAGRDALVAGSVGPLGPMTRELAQFSEGEGRALFREQLEGLLEGGADVLLIETQGVLEHLLWAVDEARALCDLPVVASFAFAEDGTLPDGSEAGAVAQAAAEAGADVLGLNCGAGPSGCIDALVALGPATPGAPPRAIMPNAGFARRQEGEFVFGADPAYFAGLVPTMLGSGASIIGGCCGTTPAHVAAMAEALAHVDVAARPGSGAAAPVATDARARIVEVTVSPDAGPGTTDATAGSQPGALASALAAGRFVISVEIDPPRSIRMVRPVAAARLLVDAGADAVNISDSAMARVRMGAMAVAFGVTSAVGVECVVHLTTRDRNLMALEAELLGAHALGLRNILALTGDPPRVGDYPTGTGVWDVDSIGLVSILARLNRGEDQAGSPIGQRAAFTIACALDPTAPDAAHEWDRLERKLDAGAHLIMTQPLYGVDQVEAMLGEARHRFGPRGFPVPVLLGVLPLVSSRHAEFLHNEVPGITIPNVVRLRMREAGAGGSEVGTQLADDLLAAVETAVAGTYLMPSFGKYEQSAELVRRVRARHAAVAQSQGRPKAGLPAST